MNISSLVDNIISGFRIDKNFDYSIFIQSELTELCENADRIRAVLCGNYVDLCSIINGKSGKCSENCKFCGQSSHYCTETETYDFLDESKIINECRYNAEKGVNRFSVVTAGRTLSNNDFDKAISLYQHMSKEKINLCASHGFLTDEQFQKLHESGVSRYHCNIETSERFFPQICTTHTYADKIDNIKRAKNNGLSVCSGGIIGMGETWADRFDMAVSLAELEIKSIPINFLIPIKNTPLENVTPLNSDDILRTVAMFRFVNPDTCIRLAAGRKIMKNSGEKVFKSGANSAITGDMLTTSGNNIETDIKMLNQLGFYTKNN